MNKKIILGLQITALIGGILIGVQLVSNYQDEKLVKEYNERMNREAELSILKNEIEELKNKKPEVKIIDNTKYVNNVSSISNEPNLSAIIAEWDPRVAYVVCQQWDGAITSGSATLIKYDNGQITATTNKHVIDYYGDIPTGCIISTTIGEFFVKGIPEDYLWGLAEDFGYIVIHDNKLDNLVSKDIKLCYNVSIGDKVVILGFPGVGATQSITATEGIISGFDKNYYVTSAKIEHGNSGGAAILLKDDCWLGIPSAAQVGSIESMGRILKSKFVISQ